MEHAKPLVKLGYIIIAFSLAIFSSLFFIEDINDGMSIFFVNYLLSFVYFTIFLIKRKEIKKQEYGMLSEFVSSVYPLTLVLFSISAHTLNYGTEVKVFYPYASWMSVLVVFMHLAALAFPYRDKLPSGLKYLLYGICGLGALLSGYMTLFILPLMLISVPAAVFFGISAHSFVPLLFLIYFIGAIVKVKDQKHANKAFAIGVLIPLFVLTGFLYKWKVVQHKIEEVQTAHTLDLESEFPKWLPISQYLPNDILTESVVMSNAFTQKSVWQGESLLSTGRRGSIAVTHNPLSVIAGVLFGSLDIDRSTMEHILESKYDLRHETHRRLWSGNALSTAKVQTEIEAYPDFRLAYVEKTLDIHFNVRRDTWWRRQQEAVYTFHLPEGSVATSLSLWINGVEEKSRLTTKGKADSAYVEIVGVQRRDPALLHWQEGNRVTVTVFPCTPKEDRKFKIGFTMPLAYREGRLHLDNVYFDGPEVSDTREEVHITFMGTSPQDLSLPPSLKKINESEYKLDGNYAPNWSMDWDAPEVSRKSFVYENQKYVMESLKEEMIAWSPQEIILDITASWKPWELAGIWDLVKNHKVYVFNREKTKLTADNYTEIFKEMQEKQFSLLPLHELGDASETLIISSGTYNAPLISDIEDSKYARRLRAFLYQEEESVKWYNLGSEVSPYVQSLESFGKLDFALGNLDELQDLLEKGTFPHVENNERQIALHQADVLIKKTYVEEDEVHASTEYLAPDHMMRLFRFNELLHDIGRAYFDRGSLEEIWIRKAEEAYVVSPVSSLIVLETLKDYERMGIEENTNTLGNAKMKNSGAVPEPHEWALILLVLAVVVWQVKGRFY